jgi:hypothetical protein
MKLLNVPLGLLLNFHDLTLVDGMSRLVLPRANKTGTEGHQDNEEEQDASLRRRVERG